VIVYRPARTEPCEHVILSLSEAQAKNLLASKQILRRLAPQDDNARG